MAARNHTCMLMPINMVPGQDQNGKDDVRLFHLCCATNNWLPHILYREPFWRKVSIASPVHFTEHQLSST